jgi:hypothetical protein
MKCNRLYALVISIVWAVMATSAMAQTLQTTAFTYQGQLNAGGVLASGPYYFTFTLYDTLAGPNVIGTPIQKQITVGSGGLFTTDLDFGQIFNGTQYWLEIKVGTTALNEQALAARQPINAVPVAQHALTVPASVASKLIHFSTGPLLNGATVVSAAPILMGFGSSTVAVVDGAGESTMPAQAGGFSFPVPFDGTIHDLQVSADLLVASPVFINTVGLEYDFTVFRAASVPNDGSAHFSSAYVTVPLSSPLRFGFPLSVVMPGIFYTATNVNAGTSIAVAAGDRIGIRVRTNPATDPSASDITQLAFSATLSYTPAAQ